MNEIINTEPASVDAILPSDPIPKAPWRYMHLSKKQRKGKTYEELQEMREALYAERSKK